MSWHRDQVRKPGVTTQVLLADMRRECEALRGAVRQLEGNLATANRDCALARAIARQLVVYVRLLTITSQGREYGAEAALRDFDALPWSRDEQS